ncbi:MAG: 50S ribosomal protein L25 [Planctomycetota bacterium]
METPALKAEIRSATGTRASFRARRAGQLPVVLYGEGRPSRHLTIDRHAFENMVRQHSRVVELEIEGKRQKVLLHSMQYDALGESVAHVDFLRISHQAMVEVEVELEFIGHPKGLSHGGEFVKHLNDLPIRCAPERIPGSIPIQVAELDLNMTLSVEDLELPEGIQAQVEGDTLVCALNSRAPVEEEVSEEAPEGEEADQPEVVGKGKPREGEPRSEERKEG